MVTKNIYIIILSFTLCFSAKAQLNVVSGSGSTPQQLVQNILVGTGVTVSNVKFNGSTAPISCNAIGTFTTGGTGTNLGLLNGIIMGTGNVNIAPGPNNSGGLSAPSGCTSTSDLQLQAIATGPLNDCATLEFDFVPLSDTIKFRYVFASEEYPDFVDNINDIFAFFISGFNPMGASYVNKNIALIPNTILPVCINSVNNGYFAACPPNQTTGPCMNCNYYVNNCGGTSIQYDGFTTVLTAWALVIPCTPYHMKLAIADVQDGLWDSGVFLEANSFSSPQITIDTTFSMPSASVNNAIEGCNDIILTFKYPYNVTYSYQIPIVSIGGTATNGVDYPLLPNMLIIPTGSDSVRLTISPFYDHIQEGTETIEIIFETSICGDRDTVLFYIQDYDSLIVTAYGDTTMCNNQVSLSSITQNGITPYQYSWSNGAGNTANVTPNLSSSTLYNLTVTDACLKTASDSALVIIDCDFAEAGADTSICLGGTATLTASGGPVFLWNTSDPIAVINVSPTVTTTYIVTVTDIFSDTDTVTVFVNPLPVIVATSDPSTICPGESSNLLATGAQTYQWTSSPPDNTLNGQQTLDNPTVSPNTTSIYTVMGTDSNSCANSTTVPINVSQLPTPHILASPNPISIFDPIVHLLDDNVSSLNWQWDLGDGNSSTQSSFYHTYSNQDTGRYLVKLSVSNISGCVDSTEIWVIVRPDGTYYVPNSFTPNGDGLNDEFKIYAMGAQEFEIYIYDRWGKAIFTTKDINEGWNGKMYEKELPGGVYNYVVIYKDVLGIRRTMPGSVTLIR